MLLFPLFGLKDMSQGCFTQTLFAQMLFMFFMKCLQPKTSCSFFCQQSLFFFKRIDEQPEIMRTKMIDGKFISSLTCNLWANALYINRSFWWTGILGSNYSKRCFRMKRQPYSEQRSINYLGGFSWKQWSEVIEKNCQLSVLFASSNCYWHSISNGIPGKCHKK